jgi:outer membrane protein assembly factor BamB
MPGITMDRGNAARTGAMPGPGPVSAPVERWRYEVGQDHVSSAIVVDGAVYVAGTFGPLCAIDAVTGEARWSFAGSGPVRGIPSTADFNGRTPAYAHGLIYACGIFTGREHALIYAVDAVSGQERWRFATAGNDTILPPAVADGIVFAVDRDTRAPDTRLYALDAATGEERWCFHSTTPMYASPAIACGLLYIGSSSGEFFALDAASGRERWRFGARGPSDDGRHTYISPAAVADGRVFICRWNSRMLHALDARSGEELWQLPEIFVTPPAVANDRVFAMAVDNHLRAINAANGTVRWQVAADDPADPFTTSPVVADGVVYLGTRNGVVLAIDGESGQERWRIQIDDELAGASPAVVDGVVYLSGLSGWLFAFAAADAPRSGARSR